MDSRKAGRVLGVTSAVAADAGMMVGAGAAGAGITPKVYPSARLSPSPRLLSTPGRSPRHQDFHLSQSADCSKKVESHFSFP